MNVGKVHLELNQPGRRAGLTKGTYKGARLLKTINAPHKTRNLMAPKAVAKRSTAQVKKEDEDMNRLPESSDSSTSEDERPSADMTQTLGKKAASAHGSKTGKASINGNRANGTTKSRSMRENTSSSITGSPKRKSQEDTSARLGAGMLDEFGFSRTSTTKRTKTKKYGSSSQGNLGRASSSQAKSSQIPIVDSDDPPKKSLKPVAKFDDLQNSDSEDSPKKSFKVLPIPDSPSKPDTEESPKKRFKAFSTFDNPKKPSSQDSPKKSFKAPSTLDLDSSQKSDTEEGRRFKVPEIPSFETSNFPPASVRNFQSRQPTSSSPLEQKPEFKKGEIGDSFEGSDSDTAVMSPTIAHRVEQRLSSSQIPATQLPGFKAYEELELSGKVRDIIEGDKDEVFPTTQDFPRDVGTSTMTQMDRCPMCNQPRDPEEVSKIVGMSVRMQEKFCRDHKRRTAKENWSDRGYPEINWDDFDARISKHHAFIKELIKGADCHYRDVLDQKVNTGKDRNLMKMTSNLIPGYYGSRGLRSMSENIMHRFTPLLKKRVVRDRLMSARGVTGFVQSVLVPEVAVLLIQEDMDVEIEEARDILTDSASMGELVNEEIGDVVAQRVDESEDDEEYEGE